MDPPRGLNERQAPLTPAALDPGCTPAEALRPRTFLHVDMDAFFASVEIRDNPALKGKPVVVGGSSGKGGVVTTASYEARRYGLHAGMSAMEARTLCPSAIFLPVNGAKYVYISTQIMSALQQFSPSVRTLSVDEASLEITGCQRLFGSFESLGRRLKECISSRFRLPCTVGLGPNRLAAKMAANLGKPDGLLILTENTAAEAFAPLPVTKMVGIGDSTAVALQRLGIRTLGELSDFPEDLLRIHLGLVGPNLKRMAKGEWAGRMRLDDEVGPAEHSMGHQRTYSESISDIQILKSRLIALAEMVARRLRRAEVVGKVLTLTLRYTDFRTLNHQARLLEPTDEEELLIDCGWRLLEELWVPGAAVRLLGLSMSGLKPKAEILPQLDVFTSRSRCRSEKLYQAMDALRDRFGERVIARAGGERYKEKPRGSGRGEIVPFGHLRNAQKTIPV